MFSIIFFGPLFILFYVFLFGSRMGGFYTALAVCFSTFFSALVSLDAFIFMLNSSFNLVYFTSIVDIFRIGFLDVSWHFYFDVLTLSIFCLICIVSFFIQIFSVSYMGEDASHVRFILYLCFFMIAMLLLVGSANFVQLFFGWELVGLASFLLINFWFARQDANSAAFKAVAVNRVGDCFLLLSIFMFAYVYRTLTFDTIFTVFENDLLTSFAFFFLIIGCFAKSAQFFFHVWLPDAMEGPTPVSALLHSATMVTAGVFLSLRFMDLIESFTYVRYIVVFFGIITALYAMSIASVADDTKRVTAYTTLNQLGFMFFGCGSLASATVLFHLIVHGFYKSYSFLSAAMELYDFEDEQDGEFDNLDIANSFSFYDILTGLVFVSINAIPFTSPSISKEFLLLSGLENMPEYFTFFIALVLFSSPVDEGRDDIDDQYDASGYIDDLYVSGSFPSFIVIGSVSLGLLSLISATFLEEIFIDINFFWNNSSTWSWLDTKGSILIFLPFLSLVLSEFDYSRSSNIEDFNNLTLTSRSSSSYQSILFNAELWYYDELITKFSKKFLSFSNTLTNYVLDKGFLEYVYVTYSFSIFRLVHFSIFNSRYSMEKLYSFSLIFTIVSFTILCYFCDSGFSWFFFLIFFYEYYFYLTTEKNLFFINKQNGKSF
jgi:NADH:ubiquinone oxidoreductase subunit 5 (subunit L)/multisubunit Na+/H+ antiporter MnhA subunit